MKQIKMKFPENLAVATAILIAQNSGRVILSYSKDEFFSLSIIAIVIIEDEKFEIFKQATGIKEYIVNN